MAFLVEVVEIDADEDWEAVITLFENAAQSVKEDRACTLAAVRKAVTFNRVRSQLVQS